MNQVNFFKFLRQKVFAIPWISAEEARDMLKAPVFRVKAGIIDKPDQVRDIELWKALWKDEEGLYQLQAPYHKVWVWLPLDVDGPEHWHYLDTSHPGKVKIITVAEALDMPKAVMVGKKVILPLEFALNPKTGTQAMAWVWESFNGGAFIDGKWREIKRCWVYKGDLFSEDVNAKEQIIDSTCEMISYLATFCYHVAYPDHLIVHVQPKRGGQGNSVEWTRARSYYTVIPHEVVRVMQAGGTDSELHEAITRVAHKRRRHPRVLKSPKFVHKQGQRIWIRETWVGPTEWEDKSGTRMYRIV